MGTAGEVVDPTKGVLTVDKPGSFLKALMTLMLPNENLSPFRAQYQALTVEDRAWCRERFAIEYGWTWDS